MADHSYKSDLEAAMSRARALEADNRRLREQLDGTAPTTPGPRRGVWALAVGALVLIGFALLGVLIPLAGARGAILAVALIVGLATPLLVLRSHLLVCQPNEALILVGRQYRTADGKTSPYRVLLAGSRTLRVPLLERAERLDLTALPLEVAIRGAYSKGGIPVRIELSAAVKISSDPHLIGNAVERFLGRARDAISQIARETLEGHVRTVVAMIELERIQQDPLAFVQQLHQEAAEDFDRLGLQLDTLAVQQIEPDV